MAMKGFSFYLIGEVFANPRLEGWVGIIGRKKRKKKQIKIKILIKYIHLSCYFSRYYNCQNVYFDEIEM